MSLITDELKPTVNTLEEVKKLQELVRKLEIQNLYLRNKQNASKRKSISPTKESKTHSSVSTIINHKSSDDKGDTFKSESHSENYTNVKDEYFDELDIIRVSDIEMSDDESWLYMSPKSVKQEHKNESPYKWLRKDVDDPKNQQLQLTKNALLSKLTELDILSPSHMSSSNQVENPMISNLKRSQILHKTPISAQIHDSMRIDTRTFTRSKKKQAIDFLEKLDALNNEKVEKISSIQLHRRGSDVSSDSISSCHILEDASDVEEVARMQEESLRMNSPLGTPKRGAMSNNASLRKISPSSRGSLSDQDLSESSIVCTASVEESYRQEFLENNSYVAESLNHSDQSSPSVSPYSSNVSLHSFEKVQGKLSGYRRSLPNLNRESLIIKQSKTGNNAGSKKFQTKSTSSGRKPDVAYHVKKIRSECMSPPKGKHVTQTTPTSNITTALNVENTNSTPCTTEITNSRVRSGLPKPSRASSASRSTARSGIPMPSSYNKKHVEDSWSEGCF